MACQPPGAVRRLFTMSRSLLSRHRSGFTLAWGCATAERYCHWCGTGLHSEETNSVQASVRPDDRDGNAAGGPRVGGGRPAASTNSTAGAPVPGTSTRNDIPASRSRSTESACRQDRGTGCDPGIVGALALLQAQRLTTAPGSGPRRRPTADSVSSTPPSGRGCGLPYWCDSSHATRRLSVHLSGNVHG